MYPRGQTAIKARQGRSEKVEENDFGKHGASDSHIINSVDLEIKGQYIHKLQKMEAEAKCPA